MGIRRYAVIAAVTVACMSWGGCGRSAPGGGAVDVTAVLGGLGDSPGRYVYPRGIDNDGSTLWTVDKTARVQRIDPESGECLSIWRMPLSDAGMPVGLTVAPGPDGGEALYVPDTHYHRVMVFPIGAPQWDLSTASDDSPEPLAVFGEYGTGGGQFIYPTDIAVLVGADGATPERIYVAEYGGNDRISIFDGSFQFLRSFGSLGASRDAGQIQFDRPQSIEIDEDRGELIVADSRNHRIGRFTLDGELVAWFGGIEASEGGVERFKYPYGLALLGDGTVLIAEYGNNRVQRLELESGRTLARWGVAGRGRGELLAPWAVTVMDGRTYILDSGNNRVVAMSTPRRRR